MEETQLPTGWEWSTIIGISETIFGQSPPSESYNLNGDGLPFFQGKAEFGTFHPTVRKWCNAPSREAKVGDILMSIRAPVGPTNVADVHCAIGRGLAAIRPTIDAVFVRHWITRSVQSLIDQGTGTTFAAISKNILNAHPVPVPPLNEQQRIVEKIETLFARLDKGEEAVRDVQKLLTRYRQSVLKSAVTGQLTAEWRAKQAGKLEHGHELLARILKTRLDKWVGRRGDKKPVEPETSGLPELPEGWAWASVDQILRAGLSNGHSVPDAEGNKSFPVMRLTALKDGLIDVSERKDGRWTTEEAQPYLVEQGDILVSRGNGSKQLVGRGGLVAEAVDPVAYPDTMIRIPISLTYLSARWFVQLWNSPFMRSQIEKSAKTTAGIYKINQGDIRSFVVPLPPLAEQEEIANFVAETHAKVVNLERWAETELKRSASLRQSILKDAFAGKLVPQDPTDEPASALLARIAAEKSVKKTPTRKLKSNAKTKLDSK